MKILIPLFVASLYFTATYAQASTEDPSFGQSVGRVIRYPAAARQQQKVAQAYVYFTINGQGKIADVSILNADHVDPIFQQEIRRVWQVLATQEQQKQGDYVMPVSFILDDNNQLHQPPQTALPEQPTNATLLKPVVVTGYLSL